MKLAVVEANEDHTLLLLEGLLDMQGASEIESQFLAHTMGRHKSAILEFSKVEYVGSFGLRLLIEAVKGLNKDGLKLIILHPVPEVEKLLLSAGMENILSITHDEAEARKLAE